MSDAYVSKFQEAERDLSAYLHSSTKVVQSRVSWFEENAVKPSIVYAKESFARRPVVSTFTAIYALLSILPIVTFLAFSIFIIASIALFAVGSVLASIAFVEAVAIIVLLTVLAITFGFALFFTPGAIASYLFVKLLLSVHADGAKAGSSKWATDTKAQFLQKSAPKTTASPYAASDDSAILVSRDSESNNKLSPYDDVVKVEKE